MRVWRCVLRACSNGRMPEWPVVGVPIAERGARECRPTWAGRYKGEELCVWRCVLRACSNGRMPEWPNARVPIAERGARECRPTWAGRMPWLRERGVVRVAGHRLEDVWPYAWR